MLSPPVLLFKFLGVAQTHSLFEKSEAKTLSFANAIITRRIYYENI